MKLALVLGTKQGEMVKPRLQGIKDNLDIDCFDNVPKFIDNALKRCAIYDRILILSNMLSPTIIKDLYNYWSSTSRDTSIVVLCKKGSDEAIAEGFMRSFQTTVVASMLVSSTTVSIIAEAVLLSTAKINEKYGIADYLNVEVDEDTAPVEPIEERKEVKVQTNPEPQPPKKEKKSLLGALFGGKKKQVKQPNIETPTQNVNDLNENNVPLENSENFDISEDFSNNNETPEDVLTDTQSSDIENTVESIEEDFGYTNDFTEDLNNNISDDEDNSTDFMENLEENVIETSSHNIEQDIKENEVEESESEEYIADNDFEDYNLANDFMPEEVDEDFGQEDFSTTDFNDIAMQSLSSLEEVDDDMSDIDITDAETAYREATEQPKVITNTVVKEVVRNKRGKRTLNSLDLLYEGKSSRVIVVTGDRGTGVTTTALSIAKKLSEKVRVLYFDCDIVHHGLLNYISYEEFRNYDEIHMQGVKLCNTSKAFDSCVIPFDNNFDIITSDFSAEISDEDILVTQNIIAEKNGDYGAIIVDCPISKLHCIPDLVFTGHSVICVDASKRGFMNMLCDIEGINLPVKHKRAMATKGLMFLTMLKKGSDYNALIKYISSIYEVNDVDWMNIDKVPFNGKLTDEILNKIIEG